MFIGKADLTFFLIVIAITFGIFYAAYQLSNALDVRKKVTKLLVGLPVYNKEGRWVGKVEKVEAEKQAIEYKLIAGKEKDHQLAKNGQFLIKDGRIQLLV